MGILSLMCFSIFTAIPGVICGHKALSQIKRSDGLIAGQGLAIGGLVTGYFGIAMAVFIIPLMLAIAIPNFIQARDHAIKQACSNNLRKIDAAKQQWALENKKSGEDVPTLEDIEPYIPGGFASLHCPAGGAYSINKLIEPPSCSVSNHVIIGASSALFPGTKPDPLSNLRSRVIQVPAPARPRGSNDFNGQFRPNYQWSATNNVDMQALRDKNRCRINLLQIQSAKRIWATRYHKQPTDVPTATDLTPYLPGHQMPVCPAGGAYTPGAVHDTANCSTPEH